jgi:hypothetical protein
LVDRRLIRLAHPDRRGIHIRAGSRERDPQLLFAGVDLLDRTRIVGGARRATAQLSGMLGRGDC